MQWQKLILRKSPPVQNKKRVVRKKASKKSVSSLGSESKDAPVRSSRKKVPSNLSKNIDGPITKTKKRTLKSNANSTENDNQPKVRTRAVKTENLDTKPKTRRVRKVSKQADEMDIALEKITSKIIEEE